MTFEERVKTVFDRVKCKAPDDVLVLLPVRDREGRLLAFMRPIVKEFRLVTPGLAELMSRWRIENPSISTGTFEVTTERTARWLDDLVVGRDDRVIFLLESPTGEPIGHLGFTHADGEARTIDFDSMLRGVKTGYPGIMTRAMSALMRWGRRELQPSNFALDVYADNDRAIRFYERLGFAAVRRVPLVKIVTDDEQKYEPAPAGYEGPVEKYYLRMDYRGGDPADVEAV